MDKKDYVKITPPKTLKKSIDLKNEDEQDPVNEDTEQKRDSKEDTTDITEKEIDEEIFRNNFERQDGSNFMNGKIVETLKKMLMTKLK